MVTIGYRVGKTKQAKLELLNELLDYSSKYQISIQFWPDQTAVYIMKDDVELIDYGGEYDFAIGSALEYLDRINGKGCKMTIKKS